MRQVSIDVQRSSHNEPVEKLCFANDASNDSFEKMTQRL
jgi:hypothetical protein